MAFVGRTDVKDPGAQQRQPAEAAAGSPVPGSHFAAAVEKSGLHIPQVSKELICKYLMDLKLIGALEK